MALPVLRCVAGTSASDCRTFMKEHGFAELIHTYNNVEHKIYRTGDGPAVVLLHELPGLTCDDIGLACRIAARGFTVYAPLFFGQPGGNSTVHNYLHQCVAPSEFHCSKAWETSPAVLWVRDWMANKLQHSGKGVGVIGMCMTGALPLVLLPLSFVSAAVICQPTFPINSGALDICHEDLDKAVTKAREKQIPVLGLRFAQDHFASPKKFDTLKAAFKKNFVRLTLMGPANGKKHPHSTLAGDYENASGTPQREAFDRVIRYLDHRLSGDPKGDDFPEKNDCDQKSLRCEVI
jgi:dienelactone hydrolase